MEIITSKSNEKIKAASALMKSASARKKSGKFFLEGARLCSDAAENGGDILQFFFTRKAKEKFFSYFEKISSKAKESIEISEEIALRLSDTQTPQGMFCVCAAVDKIFKADKIKSGGKYILLENVQDPSNLGAISRTAEALGIDALIVSGGCDIYNPKALRSSMGSLLRIDIIECADIKELLLLSKEKGLVTAASTPSDDAQDIRETDFSSGAVCVIGNEGNGIEKETMLLCDVRMTIPMNGRAESLNASTAAAVIIWEMIRRA